MTAAYDYIIDTGTVTVDTTDLLSDVQAEYKNALGQNLNVDASTPQGTLITTETLARTGVMKNNAEYASLINPQQAYGTFLDAICSFLGVKRVSNRYTQVTNVQMNGTVGTVILAGSRVKSAAGDIFTVANQVTIGSSGQVLADLNSAEYGAIPLDVETMTIMDGIIGWGSAIVTTSTVIVLGATQTSDGKLKNMRNAQLAIQGRGNSAAIQAALLAVTNVTSVAVVENNTGQIANAVNDVTFSLPNAMWVCVAGTAAQADIAQALYEAHGGGCPWDYGASGQGVPVGSPDGVSVIDAATGMTYNVKYTTPVMFTLYVYIEVGQGTSSYSPDEAVPAAIIKYAEGEEDDEPGLVLGTSISAFQIAGTINRQLPGMYVGKCMVAKTEVGAAAPTYPDDYVYEIPTTPFQQGELAIGNIQVVTR